MLPPEPLTEAETASLQETGGEPASATNMLGFGLVMPDGARQAIQLVGNSPTDRIEAIRQLKRWAEAHNAGSR